MRNLYKKRVQIVQARAQKKLASIQETIRKDIYDYPTGSLERHITNLNIQKGSAERLLSNKGLTRKKVYLFLGLFAVVSYFLLRFSFAVSLEISPTCLTVTVWACGMIIAGYCFVRMFIVIDAMKGITIHENILVRIDRKKTATTDRLLEVENDYLHHMDWIGNFVEQISTYNDTIPEHVGQELKSLLDAHSSAITKKRQTV